MVHSCILQIQGLLYLALIVAMTISMLTDMVNLFKDLLEEHFLVVVHKLTLLIFHQTMFMYQELAQIMMSITILLHLHA